MNNGLLVTGTDTSIGKTMVSCAIVAALRRRGVRVGVYKPAETGCPRDGDLLVGDDCVRLAAAGGDEQSPAEVASYLFELPAAPLVAADAAGAGIDPNRFATDFGALRGRFDFVLVEGAGGLLVPIADGYTYLDLARSLGLPLLCVVGSRLGCVNHALLTLRAAGDAGIHILGYVMNTIEGAEDPAGMQSNRETIARFTELADLGAFPFVAPGKREDYDHLAGLASQSLELDRLT